MLLGVVGLSGWYSKSLRWCFVSRKNVILKDILCISRKLWFCSTSNIPIFLAKTWCFRNLEMTLMYARGASAGNPETWALKNTCRCLKKTATLRKINWNISFFRIFHMDLNCFCTVSFVRDSNWHCATQHITKHGVRSQTPGFVTRWNGNGMYFEYSSDVSPIGGFPAFGKDGGGGGGVGGVLKVYQFYWGMIAVRLNIFTLKKVTLFGNHKISSEKGKISQNRHLRSCNQSWCLLFVQLWLWVGSFAAEFDFLTNPLALWRNIQRLWMFQFILFNVAVFLRYP